jgi:PAS domain S-box-containing protein
MGEPNPSEPVVLVVGERAALARTLRDENRRVIAEPSAEAGLQRLAAEKADAVVSEYRLPGIDGLAFLRAVRAERPRLPFALSVAAGSEELASEAISAGVSEYIPRDAEASLVRRVDALLDSTDIATDPDPATAPDADGGSKQNGGNGAAEPRGQQDPDATTGPVAAALRLKERAMDEAPVGITVSDATVPDTPLVYVNDAFERITGYDRAAVLGRNCRFLQGERSDPEAIDEMGSAIREKRPTTVEVLNYRKDGAPFWNEVSIAPIRDSTGVVTHYVGFQTDVTDRKRAEVEVESKADALMRERASLERLLDRIEGLVHETTGALVTAATREEAERAVVERIAAATPYTFAWIGDPDPAGDTIAPRTWADENGSAPADGHAEPGAGSEAATDVPADSALAIAIEERRTEIEDDPVLPAIARTDDGVRNPEEPIAGRDGGSEVGSRTGTDVGTGAAGDVDADSGADTDADAAGETGPRDHDAPEDVGTGAAIPITYPDSLYGVLCVYTDAGQDIDDRELVVLDALSNAAATAINALESRRVLAAEDVVELEFEIRDDALFFAAISSRGECSLEHAGSTSGFDGSLRTFVSVTGASADRIAEIARTCPEIEGSNPITDRENACLFEFEVAEPSLASELADRGATIREITAENGTCRLCVELPRERDARSVADALDDRYGASELMGYHERERPARTAEEFLTAVEERLTDRQLTALRLAYMSGFFETPRPVAGEELAASMGISRSTFHQHLRAAERKIAEVFFER